MSKVQRNNLSKFTKIFIVLILALALFLRVYKLDQIPPSLSWDEAAAGYNAYTIANWGKDEWGQFLPLVFTSFGDDKHPIWIYFTAVSVKLLGLSEFSTRLPAALFGVFNAALVFFLGRLIFKSDWIGLTASLSLAVSPYNLQFSRGAWEGNYALFFFMLGLLFFFFSVLKTEWSIKKRGIFLCFSFLFFGLDFFTYHSAKIVPPAILLLLFFLYFHPLMKFGKYIYLSLAILLFLTLVLVLNPRLLGTARITQSKISNNVIEKTTLFKKTKNYQIGYFAIVIKQYLDHFNYPFLFISGDANSKLSVQTFGEFYWIDAPFILIGLILLLRQRSKITLVILAWILLAPIPASLVMESPHAHRAMYLMGSIHLLIGLGVGGLSSQVKNKKLGYLLLTSYCFVLVLYLGSYLKYYYSTYPIKHAIDWQYGMKQIVEFIKKHPEYDRIFVTDRRSQPYIFFLYYLQYPLPRYLDTVVYTQGESKGYSLVYSFDRYRFSEWDPIESEPMGGVLYVVTPSQYVGLRAKELFKVKQIVYYPDGKSAFYLVGVN